MRRRIDEIKAEWREGAARLGGAELVDYRYRVMRAALRGNLYNNRRNPWKHAAICAAFEFAREVGYETLLDGIWNQVEVRGGFRCRATEMPREISFAVGG